MNGSAHLQPMRVVVPGLVLSFAWIGVSHAWMASNNVFRAAYNPGGASLMMKMALPDEIDIIPLCGDESSIQKASLFFVESFWLGGNNEIVQQPSNPSSLSTAAVSAKKGILVQDQAIDFTATYGEIMGRRLLQSGLVAAEDVETGKILGLVGLEICLLDHNKQDILNAEMSEGILKNAVASLSPKQRRQYKDCPPRQLAQELLSPGDQEAVFCLCNLAVAPTARRRGVAAKLCAVAEQEAVEWGFDQVHLKVEADNQAARHLYEQTLGYEIVYTNPNAKAVRVNLEEGKFVQTVTETLLLVKNIQIK